MRGSFTLGLALAFWLAFSWPPPVALAIPSVENAGADTKAASVQDYQAARKVAMALAVMGFLLGISRLATSEFPTERHRAESLVTLTLAAFLLLAADRMIARGIADWFGFSSTALPVFWQ